MLFPTLPTLLLPLLLGACSEEHAAGPELGALDEIPVTVERPARSATVELPEDAALESWRAQLVELAIDAASATPAYPHLKTQAQLQQDVVELCVELDQPRRALAYTERIGNWRRGVGYAALAQWLSEQGIETGFDELVALAAEESELEGSENPQSWQRDTIRSMLAVALFEFGRAGDAAFFEYGLEESEVGRIAAAKASLLGVEDVRGRLEKLDAMLPAANLDQIRAALAGTIELYERGIDDEELRQQCEAWIDRAILMVPAQVGLEVRLEMAARAAARGDDEHARAQVGAARAILDGVQWLPEDRVPLMARIARGRFVAGDEEAARAEANEALELFREQREQIQDFWRGAALRPLAEALAEMGDAEGALRVYRMAAEEGTSNPNARTRCVDLVGTCISMARQGVEPDAELTARLRATREGLTDPW